MKRKAWALPAGAVLGAMTATGAVLAMSGAQQATPTGQSTPPATAEVQQGELAAMVSLDGTLTHRARPDGSPYSAINQADGIYTALPDAGDEVACGDVLYRVDDEPVLLLCGTVPAFRDLRSGDVGHDVHQLNRNLHDLGLDADAGDEHFTWRTAQALRKLQRDKGAEQTGELDLGDAVFLPRSVRIAEATGKVGGSARPGAEVARATSDTLIVQVDLDASQRGVVRQGDRARITLPGATSVTGRIDRVGSVAPAPEGHDPDAGGATIPVFISLRDPRKARGLDGAPVQVEITTDGVGSALSVPVTALVGKAGGGFAVEVVRGGGRRELVAVRLGLFDTAAGRVEVEGGLREGDDVVVPSL